MTIVHAMLVAVGLAGSLGAASAQAERPQHSLPRLDLNELEIVETLKPSSLAIDDPMAVFAYVLGSLRERVQVYPTENYYYFRFTHNGIAYAGNIRLAAVDRDGGKVHFFYGPRLTDWNDDPPERYVALTRAEGVEVQRTAPLVYRVSYRGKSVSFVLNDLSQVKPPEDLLGPDERFLGPIFDESGIHFFLIFNTKAKVFHYLRDETARAGDEFAPPQFSDRIEIGKRTGFAFYNDGNRKILIGVDRRQSRLNTYLDGPFDQLPENFIEGETLREAIHAADPPSKGKIDRLGYFTDREGRYLIHPYMRYREIRELAVFPRCMASKSVPAGLRPRCFVIDHQDAERPNPVPLALKRR
jgi:hypothetical protein